MIAIDDKIANAIASGNRLNAFRKRLRYSFCAFNICFKYKICLKELQKGAPGTEAGVTDARAIPQQVRDDIVAGVTM